MLQEVSDNTQPLKKRGRTSTGNRDDIFLEEKVPLLLLPPPPR